MHRAGRRARLAPSAGRVPQCTARGRGWLRSPLCPHRVLTVSPLCPRCVPRVAPLWAEGIKGRVQHSVPLFRALEMMERSAVPAPPGAGPKMAALGPHEARRALSSNISFSG